MFEIRMEIAGKASCQVRVHYMFSVFAWKVETLANAVSDCVTKFKFDNVHESKKGRRLICESKSFVLLPKVS